MAVRIGRGCNAPFYALGRTNGVEEPPSQENTDLGAVGVRSPCACTLAGTTCVAWLEQGRRP